MGYALDIIRLLKKNLEQYNEIFLIWKVYALNIQKLKQVNPPPPHKT